MQSKEYENMYMNYPYTSLDLKILELFLLRTKVPFQGGFFNNSVQSTGAFK